MTEPETPQSFSEDAESPGAAATALDPDSAASQTPEPEPEPWTPARVVEWNAYYDLYVALGVLLLVFLASSNKITQSSFWTSIQAGRTMAATARPLVTDTFSYTVNGRRWVNIPWLIEWGHALVFDAVAKAAPEIPGDPVATDARRQQFAAGALVALTALVRLATVCLLMLIRHRGSGLWWSAVCATLALGAYLGPDGPELGGIAGTALVAPETWGTLLFAVLLLICHRAFEGGRPGMLLGTVPLFLAWANTDESFIFGLLVLAAAVIGSFFRKGRGPATERTVTPGRALAVLAACALACLVNPSFYRVYPVSLTTFAGARLFSPLAAINGRTSEAGIPLAMTLMYLTSVGLGLAGFVLNRRRFSPGRFLVFLVSAVLWGLYAPYRDEFALAFAATLTLNGQEWYLDRFGTEGRLGRGWSVWSVGGRAVTIVAVFTCVAMTVTGWKKTLGDPVFGFGYNPDSVAFEMAEYLQSAPLKGRVLNTTPDQGDALVWARHPTFVDSRRHVFPAPLVSELHSVRLALKEDDAATWKPVLDRYGVNAVIIDEPSSPRTYQKLLSSPNWIPFYDDGTAVLFGRADAPDAADLAYFQAHRLGAESLAYRQSRPVPPWGRPPMPMTWVDRFDRNRSLIRPQPHTSSSLHWLQGHGVGDPSELGGLPDPAHCLLAIQEARIALSRRPDDTIPYRLLNNAYRILMSEESALLEGVALRAENLERVARTEPRTALLQNRFRQRVSALNAAIQTTPPPRTDDERQELFGLNLQAFQLYLGANAIDLARDRLKAMLDDPPVNLESETRLNMTQQLNGLNAQVKDIQDRINDRTLELQLDPLQRAQLARQEGAPGLALLELEEAERTGVSPNLVRPQLVDLYCDSGQPDKALEMISAGNVDDPTLGTEPGVSAFRQGQVYFLLGNYENSAKLWGDRAIPQLRYDRSGRALIAGTSFLRGQIKPAMSIYLNLPTSIAQQASWAYDLGLCWLESGNPDRAVEPLTQALTLAPDLPQRPIAAYYLEKLGKPVPPPSTPAETATKAPAGDAAPTSPDPVKAQGTQSEPAKQEDKEKAVDEKKKEPEDAAPSP
jgi:tetratricopeptide (TPR) repeat protein